MLLIEAHRLIFIHKFKGHIKLVAGIFLDKPSRTNCSSRIWLSVLSATIRLNPCLANSVRKRCSSRVEVGKEPLLLMISLPVEISSPTKDWVLGFFRFNKSGQAALP